MSSVTRLVAFAALTAVLAVHATPHAPAPAPIFPDPYWFFGPIWKHHRSIQSSNVAFACYGGGGNCECPADKFHNSGVLINVWPGYQCAYPAGACTWDDKVCRAVPRRNPDASYRRTPCFLDWGLAEHCTDELPVDGRVQRVGRMQLSSRQQRRRRRTHQPVYWLPVRLSTRRLHVGLCASTPSFHVAILWLT